VKRSPKPWLFLAGLLLFISCSRHNSGSGTDCISRYYPSTNALVRSGQLDTIDEYFQKNHLSTNNLQFLYVNRYTAQEEPDHHFVYQVGAGLILNGLRAPNFNMAFDFDSTGELVDSAGGYTGELPNNDTTGHQSLENLRQLFLANYKQCIIEGGPLNSKPLQATVPYDDTCLNAELVYVDAGIQNNNYTGRQLVKAWLVTSADYPAFPVVTVIDNTGQAIPLRLYLP